MWEFYHVTQENTKKALANACLNQNAARTATQFVVAVARKDKWKSRVKANLAFLNQQFDQQEIRDSKREKMAKNYYTKIIPTLYTDFLGILGVLKDSLQQSRGYQNPCIAK